MGLDLAATSRCLLFTNRLEPQGSPRARVQGLSYIGWLNASFIHEMLSRCSPCWCESGEDLRTPTVGAAQCTMPPGFTIQREEWLEEVPQQEPCGDWWHSYVVKTQKAEFLLCQSETCEEVWVTCTPSPSGSSQVNRNGPSNHWMRVLVRAMTGLGPESSWVLRNFDHLQISPKIGYMG